MSFSPFLFLRRKSGRIPLFSGKTSRTSLWVGRFLRATILGAAVLVVIGIIAPPIPTLKTVVVQSRTSCARDILIVLDVSGSMRSTFSEESEEDEFNKFDMALSSLYAFAKDRPDDCFGIVVFSGPSMMEGPTRQEGYAFLLNYGVRDPDQLILPLQDGIGGPLGTKTLHQFVWGTRISEGLIIAERFFSDEAVSNAHVVVLISDLGNESSDNEKTIGAIRRLIEKDVRFYIFGVDVYERDTLFEEITTFIERRDIAYLSVDRESDFTDAYRFVDALEPAPEAIQKMQIVTLNVPNRWFFGGAFGLSMLWVLSRIPRRRIP